MNFSRIKHLTLAAWLLTLVTPSIHATQFEHVMPTEKAIWHSQDLTRFSSDKELKEITVDDQTLKVLHAPYMSAEKKGIVIILSDIDQPSISSNGTHYLHTYLTDDGFDTYAIPSPSIQFTPPIMGDITESNSDTLPDSNTYFQNESTINAYKASVEARFKALYNTLSMTRNEQLVVIAVGTSAGVFAEILVKEPSLRVDAFISISAQLPHPERNKHLAATLSLVSSPLLDIYYSTDNPQIHHNIEQRRRWVKRNNKLDYRQRELYGFIDEPRQHQRLRKEMNGFLRQL